MNILILTGRFGMGHIKCAEALKECMLSENENIPLHIETVDLLEYLYPYVAQYIYTSFGKIVCVCPDLYNQLNIIVGQQKSNCTPFKRLCCEKIKNLMDDCKPDLVIANVPLFVQYFSFYKEQMHDNTPFYVFITDVTFHNEWVVPLADLYFVGDVSTKNALTVRGVAESRIHITGIPVSEKFCKPSATCRTGKNILVMGGGLGMIPGGTETLKLLHALKNTENTDITLICGTNQKLKDYAEENYPDFCIYGCTDLVPQLMQQADMLITKPGGITTFEALHAQLPLYCITPTLEQELGNARFIERYHFGKIVYSQTDHTVKNLSDFLCDSTLCEVRHNMQKFITSMEPQNPLHYYRATAS